MKPGWATSYIEKLLKGETVKFRPKGNSMAPRINSGELVTVEPLDGVIHLQKGDIVLCTVKGRHFLHLIKKTSFRFGLNTYEIGNNKGGINGWTRRENVYGRVIKIEA